MDIDNDDDIDDLIGQLKGVSNTVTQLRTDPDITNNNVNEFVLKKAGALVERCLDLVDSIQDTVDAAPDPEAVESLASLIRAATGAIEILNKNSMSKEKITAAKDLEVMRIDARTKLKQLCDNPQTRNSGESVAEMSREEMIQHIIKDAKLIDADVS